MHFHHEDGGQDHFCGINGRCTGDRKSPTTRTVKEGGSENGRSEDCVTKTVKGKYAGRGERLTVEGFIGANSFFVPLGLRWEM